MDLLRTVANGCERFGNVERTHPQPPDPQSETGTLATHSGTIKNITHAAAARSNLDAAITMRSAETELQHTIELCAAASEIAAPKPDLDAKAEKRRF